MLAEEKGVPYVFQSEKPHSEAVTAVHPFGKVPAMRHGAVSICESAAIARYIDAAFEGEKFFPEDIALAAKVDEWVSLHNTIFDPTMIRKYAFAYIFPGTEGGNPDRERIDANLDDLKKQLVYIDSHLDGGFLVGGRLTYADLAVYPTLHYMTQFPESAAIIENLNSLPRYTAYMGSRESAVKTMPPAGN